MKIPNGWLDPKCSFYSCNELDCGFHFRYKDGEKRNWRGPLSSNPIHSLDVLVNALGKKVRVNLMGFGEVGLNKMIEMGFDPEYIFPINLYRNFNINPKLDGKDDDRWLKLIASYKGENFASNRKDYVLVDLNGKVLKERSMNEEEFGGASAYINEQKERLKGKYPENPEFFMKEWRLK